MLPIIKVYLFQILIIGQIIIKIAIVFSLWILIICLISFMYFSIEDFIRKYLKSEL